MWRANPHRGPALQVGDRLRRALQVGEPVVAVETTLFTHGQGADEGRALLHEVAGRIVERGALPALVGVVGGRVGVHDEPDALAPLFAGAVPKVASRDLCTAVAAGASGATTVSATLAVARQLGVRVQMTGGIGGVHRGDGGGFDISADLLELSRSPVALVCCGAKPILDLAQTLEALESLAVPVVGWGCDELPAFLTNRSGLRLTQRVADASDAAAAARAHWSLADGRGVLFAVPVPADVALDAGEVDSAVAAALAQARQAGVGGAALTPYLIRALDLATGQASSRCNAALVSKNAALASELAVEVAGRRAKERTDWGASYGVPSAWAM